MESRDNDDDSERVEGEPAQDMEPLVDDKRESVYANEGPDDAEGRYADGKDDERGSDAE